MLLLMRSKIARSQRAGFDAYRPSDRRSPHRPIFITAGAPSRSGDRQGFKEQKLITSARGNKPKRSAPPVHESKMSGTRPPRRRSKLFTRRSSARTRALTSRGENGHDIIICRFQSAKSIHFIATGSQERITAQHGVPTADTAADIR